MPILYDKNGIIDTGGLEMKEFEKVPYRAITVWKQRAALMHAIIWIVFGVGFFYAQHYNIPLFPLAIIGGLLLIWSILQIGILPRLRWRFHGYRITEQDVWLYDGGWSQKTTVVPLFRVQHVQLGQDPFLRRANLANVELETAATKHHIRGLDLYQAEELRDLLLQRLKEEKHV